MNSPRLAKDHRNALPIIDIKFHTDSSGMERVTSTDSQGVKIWSAQSGDIYTGIESECGLNDLCLIENGCGLLLTANENQRCGAYYVPSLGPAPRWCSFLDALTDELEETKSRQTGEWTNFKFVSRDELTVLGACHLIGTNLLKPYMHGFFMKLKLYGQLKSVQSAGESQLTPQEMAKHRLRVRMEKKLQERILIKQNLPAVNKELAKEIVKSTANKRSKIDSDKANPMVDDRFAAMFENEEFQIDTESKEYQRLHPSEMGSARNRPQFDSDEEDQRIQSDENSESQSKNTSESCYDSMEDDERFNENGELLDGHHTIKALQSSSSTNEATNEPQMYSLAPGVSIDDILNPQRKSQTALIDSSAIEKLLSCSRDNPLTLEQKIVLSEQLKQQQSESQRQFSYTSKRKFRQKYQMPERNSTRKPQNGSARRAMNALLPKQRSKSMSSQKRSR